MSKSQKLIGVDARTVYQPTRRGIGKTLLELYRQLAVIRPEWRFIMFHQIDLADNPFAGISNITHKKIDIYGDRFDFWQEIRLPMAAKLAGVDLLHCPANTTPRYPLVPIVVTVHDLIPMESETLTVADEKWARNVGRGIRNAMRIITPSEYTRNKIVERFGDWTDKITVNPWASDTRCTKVTDSAELSRVRQKYGLKVDQSYVFGFGAGDPRKNTERIILAWKELPQELQMRYALLLVGIQEQARQGFIAKVRDLKITESVILQGFADELDLPALLSGAEVLCYPSLSEGFGLPILDAFACETAVITSTTTSLPEVAGDAAILVDPMRSSSIADGLVKVLTNKELKESLVRRGCERNRQFTWVACANRVADVFEKVSDAVS
jgi:glycosyltransferase involved in cell wall biosynthesis